MKTGVFAGLITLDCIYQTPRSLAANEKQVATGVLLAAGGPATNAAIAFRALGNRAILIGSLGAHPLSAVVRDDLEQQGIELIDLTPDSQVPPPFSSIVVTSTTGDRAVISRNTADRPQPDRLPPGDVLASADSLLVDGHQMAVGRQLAQIARQRQIPVVVDAGSWKPGFETVLPLATTVIASANFCPPGTSAGTAAIAYLRQLGIPQVAVTQGADPILYATASSTGSLAVPSIQAVDTLGAGDCLHGAFCHYADAATAFPTALQAAAAIATHACQSFGTRQWIATRPQ